MSEFKFNFEDVINGLANFEIKSKTSVGLYADTASKKLEAKAKKDAPWKDKTGQSRQTIEGSKQWEGDKCNVYIAGNTQYFPYLEFCNDKQYAILKPTVDKLSPEILKGMNNLLGK
ncbi:hypothetical protein ACYIU4_002828 [Clostridium botulinum]